MNQKVYLNSIRNYAIDYLLLCGSTDTVKKVIIDMLPKYIESHNCKTVMLTLCDLLDSHNAETINGVPKRYVNGAGMYFEMVPNCWRRVVRNLQEYEDYHYFLNQLSVHEVFMDLDTCSDDYPYLTKLYGKDIIEKAHVEMLIKDVDADLTNPVFNLDKLLFEILELANTSGTHKLNFEVITAEDLQFNEMFIHNVPKACIFKPGTYVKTNRGVWRYIAKNRDELLEYAHFIEMQGGVHYLEMLRFIYGDEFFTKFLKDNSDLNLETKTYDLLERLSQYIKDTIHSLLRVDSNLLQLIKEDPDLQRAYYFVLNAGNYYFIDSKTLRPLFRDIKEIKDYYAFISK